MSINDDSNENTNLIESPPDEENGDKPKKSQARDAFYSGDQALSRWKIFWFFFKEEERE